jgi:hypothetical protein
MGPALKQVRLQKTLKEGLRRCVYRRWEATVKGAMLFTKTTDLERMYRGNTPYPTAKPSFRSYSYPTRAKALVALASAIRRRRSQGYSAT